MPAPPPLPLPPSRAPRIEWPTALVLCAMLAALVAVWALASPEQRADMLTGVAAVGGVALALMRAMLRAQEQPPAPPPSANGPDHDPPAELVDGPPTRPRRPTMIQRAAVVASIAILTGCGASALRVQALAADTTGRILDATCQEAHAARTHELEELPPTREEAHAAIDATIERWAPVVASCNALAEAHGAWADVIVRGAAGGELDLGLAVALALRIATAWPDLTALLARVHVALPPLPAELGSVALGGGQ